MFALLKHPLVDCDFEEAALAYAIRQEDLAERFVNAAEAALRDLARKPLLYRLRFDNIRRLNLRGFPYAVFYFVLEETIYVLGLFHGARDHGALLSQRRSTLG